MKAFGKLLKLFCAALLGMLGFSACEHTKDMYGTPTTDFLYEGCVTDEDGNPIKGINVVLRGEINGSSISSITLKTDNDGNFSTEPISSHKAIVETIDFVDVDGEANGGDFESLTISPEDDMKKTQTKEGDGSWYKGEFEYSVDIKLKKK